MISESSLDLYRCLFLITSLPLHHIISNKLFSELFCPTLRYPNYLFQSLSVLYLLICVLRKGYVNYDIKQDVSYSTRYCKVCKGYKPIRSHHCTRCKKCIKKMDHHCMWLGVCVNYDNHGDFMRFLFFSVLSMSVSLYGFFIFIMHTSVDILMTILLAYLILYSFLLSIFCGIMFKIQSGLISKNITFIEDQHYYIHDEGSAFDRGLWNNWCEVMGSIYTLWLWRPSGTGVDYVRNDGIENDDINFV